MRRALILVPAVLVAACGTAPTAQVAAPPTTGAHLTPTPPVTASTTLPTTSSSTAPGHREPDTEAWTAARAQDSLEVFHLPGAPEAFRTLPAETILGTPTVVLVLEPGEQWMEVLLPGRPNGQTGWVRARDVVAFEVTRQVVIDLNSRILQVLEGDQPIFETSVGVGSPSSPTPVGTFFVTDAVRITDPSGPWGPYAFGLSARSDSVTEFNGGDGIIGIHGTNRPTSIGEAQSLGCVRVPNDVMLAVAELVSVGSPVTIRA